MSKPNLPMNVEEALSYCDNDLPFLRLIIKQYWQLWPETRDILQAALQEQDTQLLTHTAHRLRGQAAALAAYQVEQAAGDLEAIGTAGAPEAIREAFHTLLEAQKAFREFLTEENLIDDESLPRF